MKKKMIALLLALAVTTATISAYKNISFAQSTDNIDLVGTISTGMQNAAKENQVDVDEDIKEDVESQIPEEWEEIYLSTPEDVLELAENCKLDIWSANKIVYLTQNISLVGKEFTGIPTFAGIFDGQGYSISEVTIEKGLSYCGFFCNVQKNAIVKDLSVSGSVSPSGEPTILGGIAGDNSGTIMDCTFKGVVSGNDYVGGICGINELSGVITGCEVGGYIHGKHFTGGIAGENMGDIIRCTNNSFVNTTNVDTALTAEAITNITKVINLIRNNSSSPEEADPDTTTTDEGGIAGLSIGIITRCINNGDVGYEHVGYNVGGIAGRQSGYILSCSNNGKILGRKDVGGIAGQAEPYITVDLSSDIAYQLTEALGKLHDIVTVTLSDAKAQSNVISNRLAVIQQFTSGAIEDVRYIADGAVDYANGVSGAATEAFARVDYALDEASKDGGVLDQASSAASNVKASASELKSAISHIDIDSYMTETEKEDYANAKAALESAAAQYEELFTRAYTPYYNYYVHEGKGNLSETVNYILSDTGEAADETSWSLAAVVTDIESNPQTGTALDGTWLHPSDEASFPVTDSEDERYEKDVELAASAASSAETAASDYAKAKYQSENGQSYSDTISTASMTMLEITARHLDEMADDVRSDTQASMNSLSDAADNLKSVGSETKSIMSNLAGRDNIQFPQFSSEYKAHTTSLANNLQGVNDNFGLLNSEANNATGVLVDDLQRLFDQMNVIMLLYTDAIDGVLEMDYTTSYEDVSFSEAEATMDATIDSCSNYGKVEGDINSAGVAGTMAIEYEFDLEGDVTGITDSKLNTSYITKCVLRDNKNYGEIVGEKSYVGGICGMQEMGIILNGGNYGNITSSSGEYVGGVVGSSLSYVVSSFSRGILKGSSYIGGIAGEGMHVRNSFSLVDIQDADNLYGAICGHENEDGEVRGNYFVSDSLAGIDKISYTQKAEPVSYDDAVSGSLFAEDEKPVPYEFNYLYVTFILDDEDADGKQTISKTRKKYGESLTESEYPEIPEKDGFYVVWDVESIESVNKDTLVTATYTRFLTTLSDESVPTADGIHQSDILVDGVFRDGDKLEVAKTEEITVENASRELVQKSTAFTTYNIHIPDDGSTEHAIRFKPLADFMQLADDYTVMQVVDGHEVVLEKSGTMGDYDIYNVTGNDVTIEIKYEGILKNSYFYVAIAVVIVLVLLILIIIIVIYAKKHGRQLPKLFRRIKKDVSKKIESKEQLFYNEETAKNAEKKDNADDADSAGSDDNKE